ncbi:MAG: class I SAM-dependent methyltransferase [Chloroflexota bacterium]|nr:class I SAM-dependent methyltransferase [Chloroflexota bacterium]
MSFAVSADAYDLYMGRYSARLAPQFADYAGVRSAQTVIDIGCGPGALTSELIDRLGPTNVFAIDPSESFVAAVRERFPGVDARLAAAERLPFPDKAFDAALAQLVVHFMSDAVAGLREMARVVRKAGVVAACVWDHAGGQGPLSVFWRAARELDPDVEDQSLLAGTRAGHLAELFVKAGLRGVKDTALVATVVHTSFEEWWGPFTLGVGPAGAYASRLDADGRAALMERCRELLPPAPFEVAARAWTARGLV